MRKQDAITFSKAPNYHPAGNTERNVQPQAWGERFPKKACAYPTHMASLSSFIRETNVFHIKTDIFYFTYSHWLKFHPKLRSMTLTKLLL